VVPQPLDVFDEPVGIGGLDGLDDPGVGRTAAVAELAPVRDLVGQRVFEGVFEVGEETRLVEELGGLEAG